MLDHNAELTQLVEPALADHAERVSSRHPPRSHQSSVLAKFSLIVLLLLALGVRVWWLTSSVTIIEGEGANYARMAENIATGKGWLGTQGHLQVFYPPLFPLLVAGGYLAVHNAELAGRLISMLFGAFLIFPIFLIARELYGEPVGYIAALIVAFHPMLVGVSAAVYSESTYLFLLFTAVWWGIRTSREQSRRRAIVAGALFGLAYLTRTEALLPACFLVALILFAGWENKPKATKVAACLVVTCVFVGAPYVWFLKTKTGQFRIEAKSADNFAYGQMRLAGVPWEPAYRLIDENLKPIGLSMRTDLDVLQTTKFSLPTALRLVKLAAHDNSRYLVRDLLEQRATGGFVLIGLVTMGLFGSPWSRKRIIQESLVVTFLVLLFLPLLSLVTYWNGRYILSFLMILFLWAAKGAAVFADWNERTLTNVIVSPPLAAAIHRLVILFAIGALCLLAWSGVKRVENLQGGDPVLKLAGLFLKNHLPAEPVVMDTDNIVAFYSGGVYRPFPYSSEDVALRYIAANKVDVLVIRERNAETSNPYYEKWVTNGFPPLHVSLLASLPSETYGHIVLYRRD